LDPTDPLVGRSVGPAMRASERSHRHGVESIGIGGVRSVGGWQSMPGAAPRRTPHAAPQRHQLIGLSIRAVGELSPSVRQFPAPFVQRPHASGPIGSDTETVCMRGPGGGDRHSGAGIERERVGAWNGESYSSQESREGWWSEIQRAFEPPELTKDRISKPGIGRAFEATSERERARAREREPLGYELREHSDHASGENLT
jgi:hypothetical protein